MHVALIVKPGHSNTGVGRYATELERALRRLGHQVTVVHPMALIPRRVAAAARRWLGIDVEEFLNNYPVWIQYPRADVYHLTSQNLATLLLFHRPRGRTVITVHDIIPWLVRHDPALRAYRHSFEMVFDYIALRCLRRADAIIATSEYTARSIDGILQ